MTTLTLFELVIRSMRKNIKHYYLYFFALIFSTVLYFVFATLQYDTSMIQETGESKALDISFQVARILLIVIVVIFTVYANRIFLKRRSKEIGLYQLIGMTRKGVAGFLILENILLGAGALLLGICAGAFVSRLFVLILMKLMGFDSFVTVSFSVTAAYHTAIVFAALIVLTSLQMMLTVYRSTLIGLFNADKQAEHPKQPRTITAAILAILGIMLIMFGYWLSGNMINGLMFYNMIAVLASTIFGTYLLFRVTISWVFYQVRKRKKGHLGLKNSMSLAPLMHRMKANANSLTLITVLSAMTLTMVALAYSFYFSAEADTRISLPYDFVFENKKQQAESFRTDMEKDGIQFVHQPIEAVRVSGFLKETTPSGNENYRRLIFLPAEQLIKVGADLTVPGKGEAILYDTQLNITAQFNKEVLNFPKDIELKERENTVPLKAMKFVDKYAMNLNVYGQQLVVSEATLKELQERMSDSPDSEAVRLDAFQVSDKEERAKASSLYAKYVKKDEYWPDFHTSYISTLQASGLFIFIAGFLGLVFLISTSSILYFKQMTEAEQEKRNYTTLRQLGFEVKDIMRGIIRKQLFVFAIPLLIGLLHSAFAVKSASILMLSDITVPSAIAMGVYAFIYFIFAILTVGYYRRIVKNAM